jgi:hypothetical protein
MKNNTQLKAIVYPLIVIILVLIFHAMSEVKPVGAKSSGIDMRADACRTFHVFNHQKSEDTRQEIDGLFCGMSEGTNESKDNDNPVTVTVITIPELPIDSSVPTTPDETIIPDESTDSEDSTVIIEDTPVIEEQENTDGNPGNTKDVGNAGENPNGNGTMDNDNAGGNGNGEHGNQGENGNGGNQ